MALERGEDRRLTLQAMAEVHLLKRDFGAALELYETLIREVPDSPKLWNERGVVLHQAGRADDALASYRQAVRSEEHTSELQSPCNLVCRLLLEKKKKKLCKTMNRCVLS